MQESLAEHAGLQQHHMGETESPATRDCPRQPPLRQKRQLRQLLKQGRETRKKRKETWTLSCGGIGGRRKWKRTRWDRDGTLEKSGVLERNEKMGSPFGWGGRVVSAVEKFVL